MFTLTMQDCDGTNLAPKAEDPGYQVQLADQAAVDEFVVNTKSGFAPAPEGGGPRPRNRVVKFVVNGTEIQRGDAQFAAAEQRIAAAAEAAKAAKKAKRDAEERAAAEAKAAKEAAKPNPDVVKLQGELGTLTARLARTKDAGKRTATEGKIAEVQQKLAALGAS